MSKRTTHEEFVKKLENINSNLIILGKYINNHTKILCKCLIDNHEWNVIPNSLLSGYGCPKCSAEKTRKRCSKTLDMFLRDFKNDNIEILNEYVNSKTLLKCYCKKHDIYFDKMPYDLQRGIGCKKCSSENYSKHQLKPNKTFLEEMKIINPSIIFLSEYIGVKYGIKCKCVIDGYEWEGNANHLLRGHPCPKCGGTKIKTNDEFLEKVKNANINIQPLEPYINSKTKIKCRCLVDNHQFMVLPNDIFKISGCPMCKKCKMIKYLGLGNEEFVRRLKIFNPNIIILEEFISCSVKVKCECKIDGYNWYASPKHLLHGHGCPQCNSSRGEKIIKNILDNNSISYKAQYKFDKCRNKGVLKFDFYLFDYNLCIEYQGFQHFEPIEFFGGVSTFKELQKRDRIKRKFCNENNIKLKTISYKQFDRLNDVIKNILSKEARYGINQ